MEKQIQKRNGDLVPFDSIKILNAIHRAGLASDDHLTPADLSYLTQKVCDAVEDVEIPTVEQIQDIVEAMLIRYDFASTAKAYILYRAEHAKIRSTEFDLMNIYERLTYSSAKSENIKRENTSFRRISAPPTPTATFISTTWIFTC